MRAELLSNAFRFELQIMISLLWRCTGSSSLHLDTPHRTQTASILNMSWVICISQCISHLSNELDWMETNRFVRASSMY